MNPPNLDRNLLIYKLRKKKSLSELADMFKLKSRGRIVQICDWVDDYLVKQEKQKVVRVVEK